MFLVIHWKESISRRHKLIRSWIVAPTNINSFIPKTSSLLFSFLYFFRVVVLALFASLRIQPRLLLSWRHRLSVLFCAVCSFFRRRKKHQKKNSEKTRFRFTFLILLISFILKSINRTTTMDSTLLHSWNYIWQKLLKWNFMKIKLYKFWWSKPRSD
jgi:hypothetical protein